MAKIKVAVYGTLRKGDYNYDRFVYIFGEKAISYIKTITVTTLEHAMVSFRDLYPALIHESRLTSIPRRPITPNITFDILEVERECYKAIHDMEVGSGYKVSTIEIENNTYQIFLFKHDDCSYETITSGDWFEYKKSKNTPSYKKGFSAFEEVSK